MIEARRIYTGTGMPGWLWHEERPADMPLFVSAPRLAAYKTLKPAAGPWALDSGGFSSLQLHGEWIVTPEEYVERARLYRDKIGRLDWIAPQDWMCEEIIREGGTLPNGQKFKGTKKTVLQHQILTVKNLVTLRELASDLDIIPVVQGDEPSQYEQCRKLYETFGVHLEDEPLVGLGSVCRRQDTGAVGEILRNLTKHGITRVHAFGFSRRGLLAYRERIYSTDSQAWSRNGRGAAPMCGHPHPRGGKSEANCIHYARQQRALLLRQLRGAGERYSLFDDVA